MTTAVTVLNTMIMPTVLALSLNVIGVALGFAVQAFTPPATMASTGIAAFIIKWEMPTGAGFALSKAAFPARLSRDPYETLPFEFDPTRTRATRLHLTISNNAPTDPVGPINLGSSDTATDINGLARVPGTGSITGGTSQFAPSVRDTSNALIASRQGCSRAPCAMSSSSAQYNAPAISSTSTTVSIRATEIPDATRSAVGSATIRTTYYLAPDAIGGDDLNSGLSPTQPWLSPNHAINCGDTIVAAASTLYSPDNFTTGKWGTVTCPGENNVAWLKCVTFAACKIITSGAPGLADIQVDQSYWGVEGWEVRDTGSPYAACFGAFSPSRSPVQISHIVFADNIANGCQINGFSSANENNLVSADYLAILGNIAYDADRGKVVCAGGGISIYQPVASDALPGTHIYIAGNFSFKNVDANPCAGGTPTDGEGVTVDSLSGLDTKGLSPYAQQVVVENNILIFNGSSGFVTGGTGSSSASIYLRHNTLYGNYTDGNQNNRACGQLLLEGYPSSVRNVVNFTEAFLNLAVPSGSTEPGCGNNPAYAYYVYNATSTDNVHHNFGYSVAGNISGADRSSGFSFNPNNVFGLNPVFSNPVAPGAPNCDGTTNVPSCMAAVIANFTPTNPLAIGFGYQIPRTHPVYDPLFPQWLCNVNLPSGLVTIGCHIAQ